MRVAKCRPGPDGTGGTTYECEKQDGSRCLRNYEQLKRSKVTPPQENGPPQTDQSTDTQPDGLTVPSPEAKPKPSKTTERKGTKEQQPTDRPFTRSMAKRSEDRGTPEWVVAAAAASAARLVVPVTAPRAPVTIACPLGPVLAPLPPPDDPVMFVGLDLTPPSPPPDSPLSDGAEEAGQPLLYPSYTSPPLVNSPPHPPQSHEAVPSTSQEPLGEEEIKIEPQIQLSSDEEDTPAVRPKKPRQRRHVEYLQLTIGGGMLPPEVKEGRPAELPEPVDRDTHYIPPVDSFLERVERQRELEEYQESDSEQDSTAKSSKGKSKSRSYVGVMTRYREKQMAQEEERVKKGMGKLVETGRQLVDGSISPTREEVPQDPPLGEFSEYDLIRHRVAEPEVFPEPRTPPPNDNSLVTIPVQEPSNASETSSIWNLNPFSGMFRRNEGNVSDDNLGNQEIAGRRGNESRRVESITEEGCDNPQGTSTPN